MNAEQIAKLKELAQAAENEVIRSHGWAGSVEMLETLRIDEEYLIAASPTAILELIALAEHSLSAQDEVLTPDLSNLTRYDEHHAMAGTYMTIKNNGDYVKFEDVEELLAATPSPSLAVRDVVEVTDDQIIQRAGEIFGFKPHTMDNVMKARCIDFAQWCADPK